MLHQRLRNFEFIAPDQLREQFVFGFALGGLLAFVLHAFANAFPDFIQSGELADFLGELIIQLRQDFCLIALILTL